MWLSIFIIIPLKNMINIKRNSTLVDDNLYHRCSEDVFVNIIVIKFSESLPGAVTTISYFTPLLLYGGIIQFELKYLKVRMPSQDFNRSLTEWSRYLSLVLKHFRGDLKHFRDDRRYFLPVDTFCIGISWLLHWYDDERSQLQHLLP